MPMFALALVFVAVGEITQVSRYYEYVSRLAPSGQQGLYMGYAFLPIAIGYFIAGPLGGYLVQRYGATSEPSRMWWVVAGIGVLSTLLMVVYDKVVKPTRAPDPAQSQSLAAIIFM
jgi:proton-dependent oligopeptide transporter, POT family